jgi:hypothetical protein
MGHFTERTPNDGIAPIVLGQERNFREKYKAWFQACDYSPYSCIGINPPRVITKHMRRGLLGQYRGGGSVLINRKLRGQKLNEVLMHEMIHYLQVQVGGLKVPGAAEPICRAEEEAFTLVDKWLREHGYADLQVGPKWWRPYGHCHEFYKPDYDSRDYWF